MMTTTNMIPMMKTQIANIGITIAIIIVVEFVTDELLLELLTDLVVAEDGELVFVFDVEVRLDFVERLDFVVKEFDDTVVPVVEEAVGDELVVELDVIEVGGAVVDVVVVGTLK